MIDQFCFVTFLDDILIFSRIGEEHRALFHNRLFVKSEMFEINSMSVQFRGFIVEKDRLQANPPEVLAVVDWPTLTSRKQLQRFIGFANSYRTFICHFRSKLKSVERPFELTPPGVNQECSTNSVSNVELYVDLWDKKLRVSDFRKRIWISLECLHLKLSICTTQLWKASMHGSPIRGVTMATRKKDCVFNPSRSRNINALIHRVWTHFQEEVQQCCSCERVGDTEGKHCCSGHCITFYVVLCNHKKIPGENCCLLIYLCAIPQGTCALGNSWRWNRKTLFKQLRPRYLSDHPAYS